MGLFGDRRFDRTGTERVEACRKPRSDQRLGVLLVVGPHPRLPGTTITVGGRSTPGGTNSCASMSIGSHPSGVVDGLVVVGGVGAGNGQQLALHAGIGDRAVSEAVSLHGDGT